MKKINSSGFVMAETLIVTVFLTVIFSMLYSSFLPLEGEYEKRENYDSVDGKYAVFWLKRMIEDSSYDIPPEKDYMKEKGYVRFECSDISEDEEKRAFCINMVRTLQVDGCDKKGNGCEIYITKYRLDNPSDSSRTWFKQAIDSTMKKYEEYCEGSDCRNEYIERCVGDSANNEDENTCANKADKRIFSSGFKEYVFFLPDYASESLNYAKFRVIATFHNKKDNNNYYSYATIEVSR